MDYSPEETLAYILFLARHVKPGDLPHAITIILMNLDFETHLDGFYYLREAIHKKTCDLKLQLIGIFYQIIQECDDQVDQRQLEQIIRHSIERAWRIRNEDNWHRLLPDRLWKKKRPSNLAFIARIAYLMELWKDCRKDIPLEIS